MTQATGFLGIMPWDFWDLTPREYNNMVVGFQQNEELQWQRAAQIAAWIRQGNGDKKITADKLLGKDKQRKERQDNVVSIDEKRQTLAELEESLGKAVN